MLELEKLLFEKHSAYPTMKSHKTTFCLLGLLSMGTTLAFAQDGAPKGPQGGPGGPGGPGGGNRLGEFLKRADTNGDSKISMEEFKALSQRDDADERFGKMDANSDGFVDQTEIASIAEKMREGMRNRQGGEGGPGGGFRRPGGEGGEGGFRRPPGEGSPEGAPKPEGERPAPPEGGRRPEGGPPGGPGGAAMVEEVLNRMDTNKDGSVDKEEYVAFGKKEFEDRFARTDTNADGKLSKEEVQAGMQRMRGPGGPGDGRGRGPGGPGGGEGGARRGPGADGGEGGGFRRPPSQDGEKGGKPRPEFESEEAPKKNPA